MAIKVPFNGRIVICETPAEAAELLKLLPPEQSSGSGDLVGRPTITARAQYRPPDHDLEKLANLLIHHQGADLSADVIATAMGLKGKEGVGPFLRTVRRKLWESETPLDLDVLLRRNQRGQGPVSWTVLNPAPLIDFITGGTE